MFRQFKKTRLAPTPSGFLHIGNVLSFSVTAALARKCGAEILLRIDDLDRARVNNQYLRDIFDTLSFLEIPWDEGPRNVTAFNESYSQIHRMGLYRQALVQLEEAKMVFACVCSRKELMTSGPCLCIEKHIPLNTANASWRLKTENACELTVKNYDGTAIESFLPAEMDNFVVRKKDGFPAYQLTSIVDDIFYGVDLVVRGSDLWPSTLAQHVLAAALGQHQFNDIRFLHHPLLVEPSGQKMSKSAGAASIKYLRENGLSKADIFGLIGESLGANNRAGNWNELAALVLKN
jgi:glutamyl/glutaminyl-tRNA synthetase